MQTEPKSDHQPFLFSPAGTSTPPPPSPLLSSSQSFLKVHICLWFLNQSAKFTTLRSNVFLFLVVLHVNLARWREPGRKICKAVKIPTPFTWCWGKEGLFIHSQRELEGCIYLCMLTLKTGGGMLSQTRLQYIWACCELFPLHGANEYTLVSAPQCSPLLALVSLCEWIV